MSKWMWIKLNIWIPYVRESKITKWGGKATKSDSHFEGIWIESWPETGFPVMNFVVFHSPSMRTSVLYIKVGHECFIIHILSPIMLLNDTLTLKIEILK
jgi:hypothetical protein